MDNYKNERELNDSFSLRQNELVQKSLTLQVLQDNLKVSKALCEERKILLGKEIKALDEIHLKVWDLQDRLCNQIWSFSIKHDPNEIIRKYPNLSSDFDIACECQPKGRVTCGDDNNVVENLILEIENLDSNLRNAKSDYLKKELMVAEKELQTCEKESPENESLKKEIKACEERISSLRLKIGTEYKSIENTSFAFLKNVTASKADSINLKRANTFSNAPLQSAPQTNFGAIKNTCNLSNKSIPDRGGFITANTYLAATENHETSPNVACKENKTAAVFNEKTSSLINIPRKKFVLKTKSSITQRR